MRKILLTLGTITTIAAPVAAVVSCGSKVHVRNIPTNQQNPAPGTQAPVAPVYKDQWALTDRSGIKKVFETEQEANDYLDNNSSLFYQTKTEYDAEQISGIQVSSILVEEPNNSVFDSHGGAVIDDLTKIGHMPKIHQIEGNYYSTEQFAYDAWSKNGQVKTAATQGTVSLVTNDNNHPIHDFHFTGSTSPSLQEILHNLEWIKTETNNADGKDEYTLMYKTTTPTSYTVLVDTGDPAPARMSSSQLGMVDVTLGHDDILYTMEDFRKEDTVIETFKSVYDQVNAAGATGLPTASIAHVTFATLHLYFFNDGSYQTKYYKDVQGVIDDYQRNKLDLETKSFISLIDRRDKFDTIAEVRAHFIIKEQVQTN